MRRASMGSHVAALLTFAGAVAPALAGRQEIVLEDLLNREWRREPVSFATEAGMGEFHVDSLRLSGPDGPVACQLSDVEFWPETACVKSARLWFVTDLAPLERRAYVAAFGPEPADAPPPEEDFALERTADSVKFTSSGFGVHLRLGGTSFAEAAPSSDIPGPVKALRLADGTWFGGSAFYGNTKLSGWSADVTAAGPVFGEVRYRYVYEDGNRLDLTVRLFARADRAQFDMDVAEDSQNDGLRVYLSRGLAPLTLFVQKLYNARRDIYPRGLRLGEWWGEPAEKFEPGEIHRLSPWGPWWPDGYAPVVRLAIGDGARELHVARRDPASWFAPRPLDETADDGDDEDPMAGVWGPWREKMLSIRRALEGGVFIDLNLAAGGAGGVRKFDVADSPPTEAVGWRHRIDDRFDPPRRHGSQVIPYREPLNVVKDYVLEWPQEAEHPNLFANREEIAQWRPDRPDPALMESLRNELTRASADREFVGWLGEAMDTVPGLDRLQRVQRIARDGGVVPHSRDTSAMALWLLTGDDAVAAEFKLAERLIHHMGLLGDFDKMRATVSVATLYDALIDSHLIAAQERRILRAQMAYLAYHLAHPATWSAERGWRAANPTMTYSYELLGPLVLANILSDHPMAERWVEKALIRLDEALGVIHPSGQWPESSSYGSLGIARLQPCAIAATRAGFGDYVSDARMKRAALFYNAIRTPPDPRIANRRENIRYGRRSGNTHNLEGIWSAVIRDVWPEASRQLQWFFQQRFQSPRIERIWSEGTWLGGFEYLYMNPKLPAEQPDWHTQCFPELGVIFRQGFGGAHEHFVALTGRDHWTCIYPSQVGALASLFAYGKPVAGSFLGAYEYQNEFLVNRVSLARSPRDYVPRETPFGYRGGPREGMTFAEQRPHADFEAEAEGYSRIAAFAALPRQDYAAVDVLMKLPEATAHPAVEDLPWPEPVAGDGQPPLWWRRQLLFVKGGDPGADANYLVMRDTVKGGQPTMWTFWTASEKLGTPAEVSDRAAFLADAPGASIVEPRKLQGDRFTALGTWGVDLEYFVASPVDTPRHTLRWGRTWTSQPYHNVTEYQDLLHLQRADDGVYYVALFPRKPASEAPSFSMHADGAIIKVQGEWGIDWSFLSALETEAQTDGVRFRGTAAAVQHRRDGLVLSIGAAGEAHYGYWGVAGPQAASLSVEAQRLVIVLPDEREEDAEITLRTEGRWELPGIRGGVAWDEMEDGCRLIIPADVTRVELRPSGR